ncbi:MAG: hypothetical protein RSC06_15595 [Clostridia bacterium]
MLKKTIVYTDYDGTERKEDFYFNLSKAELLAMELETTGGMKKLIEKITNEKDNRRLFELFKEIVLRAYGEKSADGKRFIKSKELSDGFTQTEAYSELFIELIVNGDAMAAFINGIIPQNLAEMVAKQAGAPAPVQILRPTT